MGEAAGMKYFLDTEFLEDGKTIMPISLALVREDAKELYIEFQFDEARAVAHDFIRENVLPHLQGQKRLSKPEARKEIMDFLGFPLHPAESIRRRRIEIWAYYAATDWVLFYQIWGGLLELPKGLPHNCMDLMQWWVQLGRPDDVRPPKPLKAHHALADADWNLQFYKNLERHVREQAAGVHTILGGR